MSDNIPFSHEKRNNNHYLNFYIKIYITFCKKRPACDYLANHTLLRPLQPGTPSSTLIYLPYAAHPCRQTRDSGIGHRP